MSNSPRIIKPTLRYDCEKRNNILEVYRANNCNASETARQFGVSPRSIGRWLQNEAAIATSKKNCKRLLITESVGRFPELEVELFNWLVNKRVDCKRAVHVRTLQDQTRVIIKKLIDKDPDCAVK